MHSKNFFPCTKPVSHLLNFAKLTRGEPCGNASYMVTKSRKLTGGINIMVKLALFPIVLLAALVPLCSGTVWGHILLLAITSGILLGTLSLGGANDAETEKVLNK